MALKDWLWPWNRDSTFQAAPRDYSELIDQAIYWAALGGADNPDARLSGVVEGCARLYANAFASATVEASPLVTSVVTPDVLAQVGRDFIERGSFTATIDTRPSLGISPCVVTDTAGDAKEVLFTVRLGGPDESTEMTLAGRNLVHAVFSADSERPYVGVPPWAGGGHAARAVAAIERWLGDEADGGQGWTFAQAFDEADATGAGPPEAFADVASRRVEDKFSQKRGKVTAIPTTNRPLMSSPARGVGTHSSAGDRLWRYGPEFSPAAPLVYAELKSSLAWACGVPPLLLSQNAQGASIRDSYRWWLTTSAKPLLRILGSELSTKLGSPVSLTAAPSADSQAFARTAKSYFDMGFTKEEALELARGDS